VSLLDEIFPGQCIGRSEPMEWAVRSPVFSPLFYAFESVRDCKLTVSRLLL